MCSMMFSVFLSESRSPTNSFWTKLTRKLEVLAFNQKLSDGFGWLLANILSNEELPFSEALFHIKYSETLRHLPATCTSH